MITQYPWLGPKNGLGWGWTPICGEGWAVTALCLAAIVGAFFVYGRAPIPVYVTLGAVAALILICFLTGTSLG